MQLGFRALIVLFALAAAPAHAQVVSCAANGGGGDLIDRGFYVQNFGGSSLGAVTLQYIAGTAGAYTVSLTARAGAFDGPIIGTVSSSATVATSGDTPMTFNFGNAAVTPGTTITFSQALISGPGALFFDIGNGGLGVVDNTCPNVIETEGTTAPLDTFRRNSVALSINAGVAPATVTSAIPTLGTWTLVFLAFALAGVAALNWRRS